VGRVFVRKGRSTRECGVNLIDEGANELFQGAYWSGEAVARRIATAFGYGEKGEEVVVEREGRRGSVKVGKGAEVVKG
jgi:hypothetical protein